MWNKNDGSSPGSASTIFLLCHQCHCQTDLTHLPSAAIMSSMESSPQNSPLPAAAPTPEQLFRDFLRPRHLKFTLERAAILRAVQLFGRPFEAEELLLELRNGPQRISKATVYRTLKHLRDAGLLNQVPPPPYGGGKQAHYDFVDPAQAHDHLVDLDSGKMIPFSSELVIQLRNEIARKLGFTALSHRFQIIARRK
jgi:Fur family transcriptional regulator, ferric uptake regulator